jgi:hypothetical protein
MLNVIFSFLIALGCVSVLLSWGMKSLATTRSALTGVGYGTFLTNKFSANKGLTHNI